MRDIYIMPHGIFNVNYKAAGYPGVAPRLIGGGGGSTGGSGMVGGSNRERTRFTLRDAWNGKAANRTYNGVKTNVTPFRAVNNAGDLMSRVAFTSGGSNQVNTGRIKLAANGSARVLGGSLKLSSFPNPNNLPSANTNVKWVYDGSDYIKFKKQQAQNRNYNDYSFGGDTKSNTLVALGKVRH
jgi:hypothetical protein